MGWAFINSSMGSFAETVVIFEKGPDSGKKISTKGLQKVLIDWILNAQQKVFKFPSPSNSAGLAHQEVASIRAVPVPITAPSRW